MGAARFADLGNDGGVAVGTGEVDDGDVGVRDDLVEARALRLRPDVALRQPVVHDGGDELVRHDLYKSAKSSVCRTTMCPLASLEDMDFTTAPASRGCPS